MVGIVVARKNVFVRIQYEYNEIGECIEYSYSTNKFGLTTVKNVTELVGENI